MDDLARVVASERPRQALFLLAHSMGGAIAILFALSSGQGLRGLVLSAPMTNLGNAAPEWLIQASQLLGRYVPRLPTTRVPFSYVSRDPQVVARFYADPLVYHRRVSAHTGAELVRATREIDVHMERLSLPLLIMHGTEDRVVDVRGSRQLYARAQSSDRTLKLYDGLYHHILNEPEKDRVLDDIVGWLDAHL